MISKTRFPVNTYCSVLHLLSIWFHNHYDPNNNEDGACRPIFHKETDFSKLSKDERREQDLDMAARFTVS
jgi:hypothetical protein